MDVEASPRTISARLVERWPRNLVASGLMLLAFLVFSFMAVAIRLISDRIPVVEVVFVRQVGAFLLMAPIYWRLRAAIARPQKLGLHLFRGVTAIGAMTCGLTAVVLIPLADATAIQMAEVLFATAFAALFLREVVSGRQWLATLIGFVGVVVMIRPFAGGFETGGLIALAGAVCGALTMIALRMGAGHDRVETVTFWQGLMVLVVITPIALPFWVWPTAFEWKVLAAMSVAFTIGQWLFTAAMRLGETAAIAPLNYVRLLMMAAIGWALYAEVPTWPTVVGAVLIIGSATFTLRLNARARTVPPASETT